MKFRNLQQHGLTRRVSFQTEKDKNCIFTYKWNLKNEIDKQIEQKRNKLTYKGKKQVIARGEADRGC